MKRLLLSAALSVAALPLFSQLSAPQLSSPANGASVIDVNETLTWSPALGGTVVGYEVEIAKDSNFTNPITNFPISGTGVNTSQLEFGVMYYWRVRAEGTNNTFSPWSSFRTFTTFYDEFVDLLPTGPDKAPAATVSWGDVSGVTGYILELDTDTNFSSPDVNIVTAPDVSETFAQLMMGTTYYYRVRAYHGVDTSGYSPTGSFSTLITIGLIAPAENATNQPPMTELRCNNVGGITSYRFELDTSTNFNPNSDHYIQGVVQDSDFDNSDPISYFTARLSFNTMFYWRVQPLNSFGSGNWSTPRSFTTIDKAVLTAPSDGATGVDNPVEFSWEKINGVDTYSLEIDQDPNFSDPDVYQLTGDTANETTVSFINGSGVYHWRVRAAHANDVADYSDAWSFAISPVGIAEEAKGRLEVYPIPAENVLNIDFEHNLESDANVIVFNQIGEKVMEDFLRSGSNKATLDISTLSSGSYILLVNDANQAITQKFIVR